MQHKYRLNQKVLIKENARQPWTVGKIGRIANLMDEPHRCDYVGDYPYYYVFVDHSAGSSSGCVLAEPALEPQTRKTALTAEVQNNEKINNSEYLAYIR